MKIIILLSLITLACFCSPAYAIKIVEIKNDQISLELQDEAITASDKLWALDESGKLRAIIQIKSLEKNNIQATIVKGVAKPNYVVVKAGTKPPSNESELARSLKKNAKWGGMIGLAMNSMTVKPSSSASASLTGTSFDLTALYDKNIDDDLGVRITGKYHSLKVSGKSSSISSCASEDCFVDLGYIGFEGLATYKFSRSANKDFWCGAGLGAFLAINKSSNILDTFKISINETLLLSAGMDWKLTNKAYIPVQIDYALYPDNQTSSANQIILSLGYGKEF